MSPEDLQRIVSTFMKGLSLFIPPPAPFSLAQPQQLTQSLPFLPDKFKDTDLYSCFGNTGSNSKDLGAGKPKNPSLALSYSVPGILKKNVISEKFVPLLKLLPGYTSCSRGISSEDGCIKLSVGDSYNDRK